MADQSEGKSVSVQDAVARIVKMLDENDGSLPSDEVARLLANEGVDSTATSTAVAYAVQQGDVDVDWAFRVRRRTAQPA